MSFFPYTFPYIFSLKIEFIPDFSIGNKLSINIKNITMFLNSEKTDATPTSCREWGGGEGGGGGGEESGSPHGKYQVL